MLAALWGCGSTVIVSTSGEGGGAHASSSSSGASDGASTGSGGSSDPCLAAGSPQVLATDATFHVAQAEGYVYYSNEAGVRRVAVCGGEPETLVDLASSGGAGDLFVHLDHVYYEASGDIHRVPVDGGPAALIWDGNEVARIATDGERLYWTEKANAISLLSSNMDGGDFGLWAELLDTTAFALDREAIGDKTVVFSVQGNYVIRVFGEQQVATWTTVPAGYEVRELAVYGNTVLVLAGDEEVIWGAWATSGNSESKAWWTSSSPTRRIRTMTVHADHATALVPFFTDGEQGELLRRADNWEDSPDDMVALAGGLVDPGEIAVSGDDVFVVSSGNHELLRVSRFE